MSAVAQNKPRSLWRSLSRLPRQITILGIIAVVVLITMLLLSAAIFRQAAFTASVLGFNNTDVVRPFVQLQRETLKLLVLVERSTTEFDPKAFQLQRDLMMSRLSVIRTITAADELPPETQERAHDLDVMIVAFQPLLDEWQADPQNETLRQGLVKSLTDLEFRTNDTEIRYQRLRGITLNDIAGASQILLFILGLAVLVFVLFAGFMAYNTYRFIRQQQKIEEEKRVAIAAEAAAREASRFKDQFLAVMSHELRTPLNAIIGFLGIMKMSKTLDERSVHMIERARVNAERLIGLISDILDISKIEAGRLELVPVPLTPNHLVEKWKLHTDVLAKQKEIDLSIRADSSLPATLMLDEDAITKVATNLLSNAIKFTEKGEVALDMRRDGSNLILTVKDSGIGIPPHMHEAIFESFRQVDSSNKRAYGGTGLGLAIVQQLCKAMGGTIRVDSTMGKGSTFIVTIPLVEPSQATQPLPAQLEGVS